MATKKTAAALKEGELLQNQGPSSNGQWGFFFSWNTYPIMFVGIGPWPPDPEDI